MGYHLLAVRPECFAKAIAVTPDLGLRSDDEPELSAFDVGGMVVVSAPANLVDAGNFSFGMKRPNFVQSIVLRWTFQE